MMIVNGSLPGCPRLTEDAAGCPVGHGWPRFIFQEYSILAHCTLKKDPAAAVLDV